MSNHGEFDMGWGVFSSLRPELGRHAQGGATTIGCGGAVVRAVDVTAVKDDDLEVSV
jgi:hypothetical protein